MSNRALANTASLVLAALFDLVVPGHNCVTLTLTTLGVLYVTDAAFPRPETNETPEPVLLGRFRARIRRA